MKINYLMIIGLFIFSLICGCTSNKESNDESISITTELHQEVFDGSIGGYAQSQPFPISATIPLVLVYGNITKITVDVTVTDGDANTNPDVIDNLILWQSDIEYEKYTVEIPGGETPFEGQLSVVREDEDIFNNEWYLNIDCFLHASDDQWPGPIIWRGVPDEEIVLHIEVSYEYIP